MKKRVLVAMSGGVDSSTTAWLLARDGYDVAGITMKLVDSAPTCGDAKSCCGYDAVRDARMVAEAIGIPHHVVNAVELFGEKVITPFVHEYQIGRTPNPCISCNRHLKFDYLVCKADELGYDYLATGHYALMDNGILRRGVDQAKDQSYFLYVVYSVDPSRILFPLGDLTKPQVRELATKAQLPTAQKAESQDICFVNEEGYSALRGFGTRPGAIVNINNEVVGYHKGIHQYTIGQRKGLGALGEKMFVKEIRAHDNTVVVAHDHELGSSHIEIVNLSTSPQNLTIGQEYDVQVRYRSKPTKAILSSYTPEKACLDFNEPVRAIATGQSAVIYTGDTVIGGGIIDRGW